MGKPADGIELHRGDERYPKTVEELANPPQTLYVRGDPSILDAPSLSIIGARKSTPYGRTIAEMAGRSSRVWDRCGFGRGSRMRSLEGWAR